MALTAFEYQVSFAQLWQRPAHNYVPVEGTGSGSVVLGHTDPGNPARLSDGDNITVSQAGDFDDVVIVRARGRAIFHQETPSGHDWSITMSTGGSTVTLFDLSHVAGSGYEIELNDLAIPIGTLVGAQTLELGLSFGGGSGTVLAQLPTVIFDQLIFDNDATQELDLVNRFPHPNQVEVPEDMVSWVFTVIDFTGTGLDLNATTIEIEGVIVYTGGAQVAPYTVATASVGPGGVGTEFTVTVDPSEPLFQFISEQQVSVKVVTATNAPVKTLTEVYVFNIADTIVPVISTVAMQDKKTLRVEFDDDMVMDTTVFGALNTENYQVRPNESTVPAVTMEVVAVTQVSSTTVDLAFDIESSFEKQYDLTVSNTVQDTNGNTIDADGRMVEFTSFSPNFPEDRDFQLANMLPSLNIKEDDTGDLEKFLGIFQDMTDLLLCEVDEFSEIFDPDVCPLAFLDAMLMDLGNPFDFIALTEIDKRRLVRILVEVYQQKGTADGIMNAVRFFLEVEVEIVPVNSTAFWLIGQDLLGVTTFLAPPIGSPLWYSFDIVSEDVLTADQRDKILKIADYMKPAHEHILSIIEPEPPVTPIDGCWTISDTVLGVLGVGTILCASSP